MYDEQLLKKLSQQMADIFRHVAPDGSMDREQMAFFSKILESAAMILQSEGQHLQSAGDLPVRLRPVTPAERRRMRRDSVKRLRAQGYTLMQISAELGIAENTVISDLKHIEKNEK